MKNEDFDAISAIGIATITTPKGREPVSIAFAGARNDILHVRPSVAMTEEQIAEAVAQGCNPALISASPPLEAAMRYIAEFIGDGHIYASDIYEDLDLIRNLTEQHDLAVSWSTLRPDGDPAGGPISASSAAASVYEQLKAIFSVYPTFVNRLPHVVDLLVDNVGDCNGFSVAGPLLKYKLTMLLPEASRKGQDLDADNAKQLGMLFEATQLMMIGTRARVRLEFANPKVREAVEAALRGRMPDGDQTDTSMIDAWEREHALNPANPDNDIQLYIPADYPRR